MSILYLYFDDANVHMLWHWDPKYCGPAQQVARIVRHIQNHVYLAHVGPVDFPPTHTAVVKIAYYDEVIDLEREASFYENELRDLQGTVVPRYFGYFRGLSQGTTPIGCMIMEYCTGTVAKDLAESSRLTMLACCKIHRAGIIHGDLLDGHHILRMGSDIRIVDFSNSLRHKCRGGVPNSASYGTHQLSFGCMELTNLEKTYGVLDFPAANNH